MIASAIVKILGGKEFAPLVATGLVCVPYLVDTKQSIGRAWLRGSVDEDCAAVCWFARLVLRQGDMAVLLISKGDSGASCCLQTRAAASLSLCLLGALAHQVSGRECVGSTVWREEVDHQRVAETGRCSKDIASGKARRTNESTVRGDDSHLLDPTVSAGEGGKTDKGPESHA